jgi:hypothetical protein
MADLPADVPSDIDAQVAAGIPATPTVVRGLINSVRMVLRDYSQLNRLTAGVEHSDKSIGLALLRTVSAWNDALPPVGVYTVSNFPYKGLLIDGALGYLLQSLWFLAERNELRYTDGQVSVSVSDRKQLQGAFTRMIAEFKQQMRTQKLSENLRGAMTGSGVGSDYALINENSWIDGLDG